MSKILERDESLDIYKGILIILVVIGHYIQFIYRPESFDQNLIFKFIYSYHMPFFIFLSGYVLRNKNLKVENFLYLKLYNYVIPFLSIYIINVIIKKENMIESFKNLIRSPDYGLWYLWILFLCCVYLKFSEDFFKRIESVELKTLLIILTIFLFGKSLKIFGFSLLAYYYVYFVIGYNLNKLKIYKYQNYISVIGILFYFILFPYYSRTGSIKYFEKIPYGILIYKYILAFSFLIPCINFKNKLMLILPFRVKKLILILSKYTLSIYIFHYWFLIPNLGIFSIFISIFMSILLEKLINKNRVLKFIILGNLNSRRN